MLLGAKNDVEKPYATVSVITLLPKIFVVRAGKLRTENLLNRDTGSPSNSARRSKTIMPL